MEREHCGNLLPGGLLDTGRHHYGTVTIKGIRGRSSATAGWHCPVREHWGLTPQARLTPKFEKRLSHHFHNDKEQSIAWITPLHDELLHNSEQRAIKR